MAGLKEHHEIQGEKYHTIPRLSRDLCCREDDTIGQREYLFLGEASGWCRDVSVVSSKGLAT
jgi:hypothetical protein